MIKFFIKTLLILLISYFPKLHSAEFDIKAKTGILQDFLSGKILYEMEGVDEELAKEVTKFFYASLVLSSEHYDSLVSELADYFENVSVDGLSEFNLPVNRLIVKKPSKLCSLKK